MERSARSNFSSHASNAGDDVQGVAVRASIRAVLFRFAERRIGRL